MGLLDRIGTRRSEPSETPAQAGAAEQVFATKALKKFLRSLTERESPVLLDLGPVVGPNVSFFGEQLGCKILVEDIFADLERHLRNGTIEELPDFLTRRFVQGEAEVDGILCWDVIDYLDRPAAQALATQLMRVLRPGGSLLGFFGTAQPTQRAYTKYLIVDEENLKHRAYPAVRGRLPVLQNRDIMRLFPHLLVSDSFLLKNNFREILFRKPATPEPTP